MAYSVGKFSFDIPTKVATLDVAYDTITVQEIVDTFRDFEDLPEAIAYGDTIAATGKDQLADGATIITATLLNGWRIAFAARPGPTLELGTVTGGNIVAVTGALGTSSQYPIVATANISVSIAQATTGALLGSRVPEYQGGIWVDAVSGTAGTAFPIGTPGTPVDNLADAVTIAMDLGLRTLFILADVTCSGTDLSGYRVEAASGGATITFSGCNVTGSYFERLFLAGSVTGQFSGDSIGFLNGFSGISGTFQNVIISGDVTVAGAASFINASSGVPGGGTPSVSGAGISDADLEFRRYTGGLRLTNIDDANVSVSVDLLPGHLIIDATVTAGDFKVRGMGEPLDIQGTPDTLDVDGFIDASDVIATRKRITADEALTEAATGNYTIIDSDDGVTVLATYTVLDKNGNPITIDPGAAATRTKI